MHNKQTDNVPPILGFAAFSGTGKTTLLRQLIPLLKSRGLKIGLIKHSHHDFEIDYPGKDSHELRLAGATPVMIVSPHRRVTIEEFANHGEIELKQQLACFPADHLDLLLIEGFRDQAIPKLELHRPVLAKPLLYPNDPHIIAIASDQPLKTPNGLTLLNINAPLQIAEFIVDYFDLARD